MKKYLFYFAVLVMGLIVCSCEKEVNNDKNKQEQEQGKEKDCEKYNTGVLEIYNSNDESVDVFINYNPKGSIREKGSFSIEITAGTYTIYCAESSDGEYDYEFNTTVSKCKTTKHTLEFHQLDCEKRQYGFLTIKNTSSNPYNIYVNGTFINKIAGKTTNSYNVPAGSNGFYAKQVSGYVFYPTEVNWNVNVSICGKYSWTIP